MAKTKRKVEVVEVEVSTPDAPTPRDFAMARLAAGRAYAAAAVAAFDEALADFAMDTGDADGEARTEAVAEILEYLGSSSRATEACEVMLDKVDMEEGEPWGDDEDDDDDRK